MGTVYLRGRIWWVQYYKHGRCRNESSKSGLKTEAQRLLRIREGELAKGHPLLPAKKTGRDAYALVTADYEERGLKSLAHIQRYWDLHLSRAFGSVALESMTYAALSDYRTRRMTQRASKATINREMALVSRMLTLAVRRGWIVARPPIPKVAERNARQGFFEPSQYELVKAHLGNDTLAHLLTLAYWTGWRVRAELLTLTWAQIDRVCRTLRLEPEMSKNAEGRTFPYGAIPEVVEAFEALWAEREARERRRILCPWVFARRTSPERIQSFRKRWRQAARRAGCPWAIPHDFRRTAVRNLVRRGVSEKVAMQLTGHKTRSVFDRYDIVSGSDLDDAVRRYAEAHRAGRGHKGSEK